MKTLLFKAMTPDGTVIEEEVEYVLLPSSEGGYGVLPNHLPKLLFLQMGFCEITKNGAKERIFVMEGTADVQRDKVTVLSDFIVKENELEDALAEREAYYAAEKQRRRESYYAYRMSGVELARSIRNLSKKQNINL